MNYQDLKKKYNELIPKILKKNQSILIESFIEYYLENNRNIISNKYDEIVFIYYLNIESIKYAIEDFLSTFDDKEKYADLLNFYKVYNNRKISFEEDDESDILERFIGCSNPNIFNNIELNKYLNDNLTNSLLGCDIIEKDKKIYRIIFFPILTVSEGNIIHEINHAITRDILATINDNNTTIEVGKVGLDINFASEIIDKNMEDERITEELINEKASQEITEIFKRKGGDLTAFCYNLPFMSPYSFNLYLVDSFYNKFKEYIKVARITENKNELLNRVNPLNYNEFVKLINENYEDNNFFAAFRELIVTKKIDSLLNEMEKSVQKSRDLTEEELEEYYKSLKEKGLNIKILNKKR